jgi:hypothetical protein
VDNLVCSEWRGQEGRGKSSHDYEASNIMLSAASRIALLPVARSTRLWTATFTPRSTRARRLTTTVTTAHAHDTLPLSDAQRKTIYALSTPPGKSGIAVIRVSGPEALSVWQRMVRSARLGRANTARLPEPWKLERCHILDPHTSEILDEALAVFFRGAPAYCKSLPSSADERTRRRRRRARTQRPARSPQRMCWSYMCMEDARSSARFLLPSHASLGAVLPPQASSRVARMRVVDST